VSSSSKSAVTFVFFSYLPGTGKGLTAGNADHSYTACRKDYRAKSHLACKKTSKPLLSSRVSRLRWLKAISRAYLIAIRAPAVPVINKGENISPVSEHFKGKGTAEIVKGGHRNTCQFCPPS